MIVVDTSAFLSLTAARTLDLLLDEFDVHTTDAVTAELAEVAEYDDDTARHADRVLDRRDRITVHGGEYPEYRSARVDAGEGSCAGLSRERDAAFLITDDLRALPELRSLTGARIAISPVVLKALVNRGVLERAEALERLDEAAEERDWLEAPIYRRARGLFD
jgi:predicted nucleic acid-binding protein